MSTPHRSTRRKFLKQAAAAGAVGAAPMFVPARVLGRDDAPGANGEVRIGFIGAGGRARQLMDQVPEPGRIVAVADCYLPRAEEAAQSHKAKWGVYQDYREMFDKEQLDAVVIATPDHA